MKRPWLFQTGGRIATVVVLAAAVAIVLVVRGLPKQGDANAATTTEAVQRRDITLTVEATGTVEPINLIEVKSKASGLIVRMPVEIGSKVQPGDLLVQVDPRDVQNAFDQAQAALVAADARARVAAEQRKRSDDLVSQQVITATEHEAAMLDDANAKSQLVAARTNLDLAKQRLEDATVRASIAGTILEKPVAVGQVISSATSSVSGGTTLLKMAALDRIRMRALVVETDIGRVKPGQVVTVVVDAYPQRSFRGEVEKIEPQALIQQSVTMFPVLIAISNEEGLLLPGMNGEVTMMVDQRHDVLAVPLDAIRSVRELAAIAEQLGLDPDSLRAGLRSGGAPRAAAGGGDSARVRSGGTGRAGADSAFGGGRRGGGGQGGRDPERAARWRERMAAGGGGGGTGGGSGAASGGGAAGRVGAGSGATGGGAGGARSQVAVVKTAEGLKPRLVRIGLSDYEYAEVLQGLEEGDQVLLLGVVEMQAQRDRAVSRVRERVGGGVTGTTGGTGGSSGAGGSGATGGSAGRRGGGN